MDQKSGKNIRFLPMDRVVLVSHKDKSILGVAQRNDISIATTCGGYGTCGACRIFLEEAETNPEPNEIELEMIEDRGFLLGERLACQIIPDQNMTVRIPTSE